MRLGLFCLGVALVDGGNKNNNNNNAGHTFGAFQPLANASADLGVRSPLDSLVVTEPGAYVVSSSLGISGICAIAARGVESPLRLAIAKTLKVDVSLITISEYIDKTPELCVDIISNATDEMAATPANVSGDQFSNEYAMRQIPTTGIRYRVGCSNSTI